MSDEQAPPIFLVEGDPFDWESYISNYQGRTKIHRLLFIATHSPTLRAPAAEAAAKEIQAQTADVSTYQAALLLRNTNPDVAQTLIPADQRVTADSVWIKQTQERARSKMERLELELRQYMNNLIKESIRMAHRDLGHHARYCGDLATAFGSYTKTRDYCTTSEAVMEMCLNSIDVCIELGRWSDVLTYVGKAESQLDTFNPLIAGAVSNILHSSSESALNAAASGSGAGSSSGAASGSTSRYAGGTVGGVAARGASTAGGDAIGALFRAGLRGETDDTTGPGGAAAATGPMGTSSEKAKARKELALLNARLKAAQALALFRLERYTMAARAFLDCDAGASEAYIEFISPADIALYGVFCSLSGFTRTELKTVVLERTSFSAFLEHEPHAREMLEDFAACRYRKVLDMLEKWKSRHSLDIHLSPVLDRLSRTLTRRAICQFVEPYQSVAISRISEAFSWDRQRTQTALVELVRSGDIKARVNTVAGVLEVDVQDERAELFTRALKVGTDRSAKSRKILFRMNLVREGIIVKETKEDPLDYRVAMQE
ncbi:hypothetical protein OC846_004342 [Tilletia horrida]|uniref:PCI domain-containing protein n=1 Tax=Tilletia horrida TaxID=155126 RepID=A0AAN6GQP4_9BASI|nr:hypothetical protein OC846_004342 [Tilletia horrida]KAK0565868.1 hypothetical protein OC861_003529 [Tilletia horrida]